MSLIPLKLPPGIYRVGTDFEGSNRWRDANLVRWHQGSMRPVGGWSEKADISSSITATPRAMHTWIDNTQGSNTAIGTASELLYVNVSGTAFDITPSGFVAGDDDAAINVAYGGTYYGSGL